MLARASRRVLNGVKTATFSAADADAMTVGIQGDEGQSEDFGDRWLLDGHAQRLPVRVQARTASSSATVKATSLRWPETAAAG